MKRQSLLFVIFVLCTMLVGLNKLSAQDAAVLSMENIQDLELVREFDIGFESYSPYPSYDGRYLVFEDSRGFASAIWEVSTGDIFFEYEEASYYALGSNIFSPDGRFFLTQIPNGRLALHDLETQEIVKESARNLGDIFSFDFSSDGRFLAVGYSSTRRGLIEIWDLESFETLYSLEQDDVFTVRFSPNNQILVTGTNYGEVYIWLLDGSDEPESIQILNSSTTAVFGLGLSSDSRYLAIELYSGGSGTTPMIIVDLAEGSSHYQSNEYQHYIIRSSSNVVFYREGRNDNGATFMNMETLETSPRIDNLGSWSGDYALSLDDTMFISHPVDEDSLSIWDVETGELVHTIDNQRSGIFLPDGKTVVTISETTISVWQVAN